MMLKIGSADARAVEAALDLSIDKPAVVVAGTDDGKFVGSGGLAWDEGRCWLWFNVKHSKPEYARPVLRAAEQMKRKARQLGETEIYTIRDPNFATSPRLLSLTGFQLHGVEAGKEVYRCEI